MVAWWVIPLALGIGSTIPYIIQAVNPQLAQNIQSLMQLVLNILIPLAPVFILIWMFNQIRQLFEETFAGVGGRLI